MTTLHDRILAYVASAAANTPSGLLPFPVVEAVVMWQRHGQDKTGDALAGLRQELPSTARTASGYLYRALALKPSLVRNMVAGDTLPRLKRFESWCPNLGAVRQYVADELRWNADRANLILVLRRAARPANVVLNLHALRGVKAWEVSVKHWRGQPEGKKLFGKGNFDVEDEVVVKGASFKATDVIGVYDAKYVYHDKGLTKRVTTYLGDVE
jgi:hypothetical protein